jgi:hypothetical protein
MYATYDRPRNTVPDLFPADRPENSNHRKTESVTKQISPTSSLDTRQIKVVKAFAAKLILGETAEQSKQLLARRHLKSVSSEMQAQDEAGAGRRHPWPRRAIHRLGCKLGVSGRAKTSSASISNHSQVEQRYDDAWFAEISAMIIQEILPLYDSYPEVFELLLMERSFGAGSGSWKLGTKMLGNLQLLLPAASELLVVAERVFLSKSKQKVMQEAILRQQLFESLSLGLSEFKPKVLAVRDEYAEFLWRSELFDNLSKANAGCGASDILRLLRQIVQYVDNPTELIRFANYFYSRNWNSPNFGSPPPPELKITSKLITSQHKIAFTPENLEKGLQNWADQNSISIKTKTVFLDCLQNKLSTLQLENTQLPSLPIEIAGFYWLKSLVLDNNNLTELPPGFELLLTHLQHLSISKNRLRKIPLFPSSCNTLKTLNLCDNKIDEMPINIGNAKNLEELWLDDNQIKSLPPSVFELRKLRQFGISHNLLAVFPNLERTTARVLFPSLKLLDFRYNKLRELPDTFFARLPKIDSCSIRLEENPLPRNIIYFWKV